MAIIALGASIECYRAAVECDHGMACLEVARRTEAGSRSTNLDQFENEKWMAKFSLHAKIPGNASAVVK